MIGQLYDQARWYSSDAAEAVSQVKASAGRILFLAISNSNAAARYAYVFDSSSANAGTLLLPPLRVPASDHIIVELDKNIALPARLGIRVCPSTTQATFTVGTADFHVVCGFL